MSFANHLVCHNPEGIAQFSGFSLCNCVVLKADGIKFFSVYGEIVAKDYVRGVQFQ